MTDKLEYFEKIYVSAPIAYGILLIVGLIYPPAWVYLFSTFFAFVLSDLILNTVIHGGNGYAKIFNDNDFANKGHAYLAYLVGIVVGTVLSGLFADWFMGFLQTMLPWYQALLITNTLASIAVAADLEWRFYNH